MVVRVIWTMLRMFGVGRCFEDQFVKERRKDVGSDEGKFLVWLYLSTPYAFKGSLQLVHQVSVLQAGPR